MPKPLSLDLRCRLATALTGGLSVRAAAKRFGVSAATASRMGQLARSGKGMAPSRIGGTVKPILRDAVAEKVMRRLAEKPDLTTRALSHELKADGIDVSHDTVWRFIRSQGNSFKKNADRG